MNYEKEYKKLKADIEKAYLFAQTDSTKAVLEHILPELRKSEDEKIRKEILEFFQQFENEGLRGVNISDWIAWLEKLKVFAEYGDGLYYFGNNDFTYVGNPTWDMSWLEKQGHTDGIIEKAKTEKQRVIITETDGNANIDWDTRSLEDARKLLECGLQYINTELEKQGKVPPADKSEPKFHEGDWVVFNNRHDSIYQVEKIENYEYTLRHFLGGSMPLSFSHEDMIRVWNVKDARNGDVLAFYSEYKGNKMVQVGIIKKYVGKHGGCSNTFNIYVGVNWENNLQIGEYMGCSDIRPATKDQRDTLMKAMTDAGYTFDFEKKELKKLKFRVGDVIEPAKPNGSYIPVRVRHISDGSYSCESDDRKAFSSIPICNENEYVLTEQKPAEWSEEDEDMVRYIGNAITCKESAKYLEEKGVDMIKAHRWLESRSQKQWKPNEKQIKALRWVLQNIPYNTHKEEINELLEQLKKL